MAFSKPFVWISDLEECISSDVFFSVWKLTNGEYALLCYEPFYHEYQEWGRSHDPESMLALLEQYREPDFVPFPAEGGTT